MDGAPDGVERSWVSGGEFKILRLPTSHVFVAKEIVMSPVDSRQFLASCHLYFSALSSDHYVKVPLRLSNVRKAPEFKKRPCCQVLFRGSRMAVYVYDCH